MNESYGFNEFGELLMQLVLIKPHRVCAVVICGFGETIVTDPGRERLWFEWRYINVDYTVTIVSSPSVITAFRSGLEWANTMATILQKLFVSAEWQSLILGYLNESIAKLKKVNVFFKLRNSNFILF